MALESISDNVNIRLDGYFFDVALFLGNAVTLILTKLSDFAVPLETFNSVDQFIFDARPFRVDSRSRNVGLRLTPIGAKNDLKCQIYRDILIVKYSREPLR
jgi:hypothetical protein